MALIWAHGLVSVRAYQQPHAMADQAWLRPFKSVYGASWLYPFKGVVYFLGHPFMYPLLKSRLLPVLLLSICIYALLFLFAFLPQVAFLALFHGPGAWPNAAVLTLGEGAAIVGLLFEAFWCDETQVDIFDTVGSEIALRKAGH